MVPEVLAAITSSLKGLSPFAMIYESVGAFPNNARPRVVWIGCSDRDRMVLDAKGRLEAALEPYGCDIEEREFRRHITTGRVRGERNLHSLATLRQNGNLVRRTTELRSRS